MSKTATKLTIVSPCYNEHEILSDSAKQLIRLIDSLVEKGKIVSDSTILFVNDGSLDNTWKIIYDLCQTEPYICGLNLAGNVGHQNAIMAGMITAKDFSDIVITIDVDLQDDLNAIEEMVDRYNEGYDIVYGVKVCRQSDSFMKRYSAVTFYKLQAMFGVKAVYNHADFRLLSRRVIEQLSLFEESNLYLRGIIPMLGFKATTVNDVISPRKAGESKYSVRKMLVLAVDGITSFSTRPITLIFGIAFLFLFISILISCYAISSYLRHSVVPGWTSIMLSLWFIGSVVLFSIGVIGQYIGKIFMECKKRPRYTIESFLYNNKMKSE